MQHVRSRMEKGGVLSLAGVHPAAQSFLAFALQELFPARRIMIITESVRAQESFQQDLETWFSLTSRKEGKTPLFYPSWEILPHESKLPHADVISERLETLIALTRHASRITHHVPLVVTSVAALLQSTFPRQAIAERTRTLKRRERIDP